ncbi:MAG: M48 family metallopeptidase, partial [Planctomycetota bacterium]
FRDNVQALVDADGKLDLFEYTVSTMLFQQLDVHFGRRKPTRVRHRHLGAVKSAVVAVISKLAHSGHETDEETQTAFDAAMAEVEVKDPLLPKKECTLKSLAAALETLSEAAPQLKRRILAACAVCIAADRQVTPREAELLQTIAAVLGCPIPPITMADAA